MTDLHNEAVRARETPIWVLAILLLLTLSSWSFAGWATYVGSPRALQMADDFDVPLSIPSQIILEYGGFILPVVTVIGLLVMAVTRAKQGLWGVIIGIPLVLAGAQFAIQLVLIQGLVERVSGL